MPKNNVSVRSVKHSNGNALAFGKLTKAQLIELLQGDIKNPITPEDLYRAAVSIVAKWCHDVVSGGYASVYSVKTQLNALQNIYRRN